MAKIDPLKIVTDSFGQLVKFFDTAYKERWLLYLIIGLIVFAIYVMFFG